MRGRKHASYRCSNRERERERNCVSHNRSGDVSSISRTPLKRAPGRRRGDAKFRTAVRTKLRDVCPSRSCEQFYGLINDGRINTRRERQLDRDEKPESWLVRGANANPPIRAVLIIVSRAARKLRSGERARSPFVSRRERLLTRLKTRPTHTSAAIFPSGQNDVLEKHVVKKEVKGGGSTRVRGRDTFN